VVHLIQQKVIRDADWLEKHGRCLDNIRPGISHLPHAAQGAFATRDLPKGHIITTSPVHHFANGMDYMTLHEMEEHYPEYGDPYMTQNDEQVRGFQLLLNYCYGSPTTTLLLFPYGAGISYINHNPDSTLINVAVRWAETFEGHNHTYVELASLETL
jgi:hypothetical protein